MNKIFKGLIIFGAAALSFADSADADYLKPLKITAETTNVEAEEVLKDDFIKAKYSTAENKFVQVNIRASYEDFNEIVECASSDDYTLLLYGIKMAEYGFFDLADRLIEKLGKNSITEFYISDMERYYYPSEKPSSEDIIYFADAYSNIMYNNMAIETATELSNSGNVPESDYKDYMTALGFYKSNNMPQALKYINLALDANNTNINYYSLKAKILADAGKNSQAEKIIAQMKKEPFRTVDFQRKIRETEEYVLYKISKAEPLKNYHLAYFYRLQGNNSLALKVLQSSLGRAKQYAPMLLSLSGRICYENNDSAKAREYAERAYKNGGHNYLAALTLADINYDCGQYEQALKYYKKAEKLSKNTEPSAGAAKTYSALRQDKKSRILFEKLLNKYGYDESVLTASLGVFPQKTKELFYKIISVDIANNDVWLALANLEIRDKNYVTASAYLNNSYHLDTNNFKYYFYLSLVQRANGETELANRSLKKCFMLNSDYETNVNKGVYEE